MDVKCYRAAMQRAISDRGIRGSQDLLARLRAAGMGSDDPRTNPHECDEYSDSALRKWLTGHPIPDLALPFLGVVLGLPQTKEDVEARYEVTISKARKKARHQLTQSLVLPRNASVNVNRCGCLGPGHFLVVTTRTARPLVLEPEAEGYGSMLDWLAASIHAGALFGLVTPTFDLARTDAEVHAFRGAESYQSFVSRFDDLRRGVIERLESFRPPPESAADSPEEIAYSRMQRFEWGDFPFTAVGEVVCLFGHRQRLRQGPDLHIATWSRTSAAEVPCIVTEDDSRRPSWMANYIHVVSSGRAGEIQKSFRPSDDNRLVWESKFIECLKARMDGNPDPLPPRTSLN